MKSYTSPSFRKLFARLPTEIKQQAREAYKLFQQDPHHPPLHFKQVHQTRPIYSVRVTYSYRAVGILEDKVIIWFWIGPHDGYDKLLRQL